MKDGTVPEDPGSVASRKREGLRLIAVTLWLTGLLIVYDLAKVRPASIPSAALPAHLAEILGTGLAVYGSLSLLALTSAFAAARWYDRRRGRSRGSATGTLPFYSGIAGCLFLGVVGFCIAGDRRPATGWGTAPWLADLQLVAVAAVFGGWAAARALEKCLRSSRPALRVAALVVVPAVPAIIGALPVIWAAGSARVHLSQTVGIAGRTSVVLIVADSLRADALSCYGGRGARTPALDELASGGARFAQATAQASGTPSSVATILTSLLPSRHGVRAWEGTLAPGAGPLAEFLVAQGYDTAAIVASPLLGPGRGLDRGFRNWHQVPDERFTTRHSSAFFSRALHASGYAQAERQTASAAELMDRALEWLAAGRRPRFLYLQLMEPQEPSAPPAGMKPADTPISESKLPWAPSTLPSILQGDISVDEADVRGARERYDGAVSGMDRELKRLLQSLRGEVEAGTVAVLFTSDHGEEFLEHGFLGHGHALYQELIHVPLIVVSRGAVQPGTIVEEPVSHLDVAPTILDLAGLPPNPAFEGRSLLPLIRGQKDLIGPTQPILSEESYLAYRAPSHEMRAARAGPWKVILFSPNVFGVGSWRKEAYNLETDPGETNSIGPGSLELDRLESWLRRRTEGEPQ